jgi:hypothetical protein
MAKRLEQANNRPIIFVAHSLGGIVVKSVRVFYSLIIAQSQFTNNAGPYPLGFRSARRS